MTLSPANHVTFTTQRDVPIVWQTGPSRVGTDTASAPSGTHSAIEESDIQTDNQNIMQKQYQNALESQRSDIFPLRWLVMASQKK